VPRPHCPRASALAGQHEWHAHQPIRPIWGFWGSKVPQNVRFPAQNADEPCAKFDAVSFILGAEILNRTNTHTKLQTNSNRYIHTLPIGMCK